MVVVMVHLKLMSLKMDIIMQFNATYYNPSPPPSYGSPPPPSYSPPPGHNYSPPTTGHYPPPPPKHGGHPPPSYRYSSPPPPPTKQYQPPSPVYAPPKHRQHPPPPSPRGRSPPPPFYPSPPYGRKATTITIYVQIVHDQYTGGIHSWSLYSGSITWNPNCVCFRSNLFVVVVVNLMGDPKKKWRTALIKHINKNIVFQLGVFFTYKFSKHC